MRRRAGIRNRPLAKAYHDRSEWSSASTGISDDSASPTTFGDGDGDVAVAPLAEEGSVDAPGIQLWPWSPERFEVLGTLVDAPSNEGQVLKVHDRMQERHLAAKRMPNSWVRSSPKEFAAEYPDAMEHPWNDILVSAHLTERSFPYACKLCGVYRDEEYTYVVMDMASEGDLFSFCSADAGVPGLAREATLLNIIVQMFDCMRALHDDGIVHGDISLENLLLTRCGADADLALRIIDFGRSALGPLRTGVAGKAAYQAPEMHRGGALYDGFKADAFALGVALYSLLLRDFPWASTAPGACRCFGVFHRRGFREFILQKRVRGTAAVVADCISQPMAWLLEGLLDVDPQARLGLTEPGAGRSVWEEPLLQYARRLLPGRRADPAEAAPLTGRGPRRC